MYLHKGLRYLPSGHGRTGQIPCVLPQIMLQLTTFSPLQHPFVPTKGRQSDQNLSSQWWHPQVDCCHTIELNIHPSLFLYVVI
jgi:hypothetical protein